MTSSSFFKSRPVKYGALAATTGLVVGIGGSVAISLYAKSKSSLLVDFINANLSSAIILPNVTAVVAIDIADIKEYYIPITFKDLTIFIPSSWIAYIKPYIDKSPDYVFHISFVLCASCTPLISLMLGLIGATIGALIGMIPSSKIPEAREGYLSLSSRDREPIIDERERDIESGPILSNAAFA